MYILKTKPIDNNKFNPTYKYHIFANHMIYKCSKVMTVKNASSLNFKIINLDKMKKIIADNTSLKFLKMPENVLTDIKDF